VLTSLKEHPEAWTKVDAILEFSGNQQTKYYALLPPLSSWPKLSAPSQGSSKATEALGVDGIPVSVLKKGIE
ncbi:Exportin1like, partial [Caligus rogercresseyi]